MLPKQGSGCEVGPSRIGCVWSGESVRLRSGESGGQGNILNSLSCSSTHSWTVFAVWQGVLSCWKKPLPSGNTIAMKGVYLVCNTLLIVGICQSNIHMNARMPCYSYRLSVVYLSAIHFVLSEWVDLDTVHACTHCSRYRPWLFNLVVLWLHWVNIAGKCIYLIN